MKFFAAYPSTPPTIAHSVEVAEKVNESHVQFETWRTTFGPGKLIDQSVLPCIEQSDGLLCDITLPNDNVFFEIGYAIGLSKPIIPIVNSSVADAGSYLRKLGLLDNVGQIRYENSSDLVSQLKGYPVPAPIFPESGSKISSQPLLVLDSLRRNEVSTKLISAVKELAKFFRTVDPQEEYRLSARTVWELVSESTGLIVTMYSQTREDWQLHNLRASFLSGLAIAQGKVCLILVDPEANKPLDYIDICKTVKHPDHVREAVEDLIPRLYAKQLEVKKTIVKKGPRLISSITVGSNAAENEMRDLKDYFVETHDFKNALEGRGRLVVGRKGAGKTAIFWRVRDTARENSSRELVLDLKPDGYQLRKFKEQLVKLLAAGTKEHTLTAFWEYIVYGEIIHKIFETDYQKFYGKDPKITALLDELQPIKSKMFEAREGDFSERMIGLIRQINERFKDKYGQGEDVSLHTAQVTELLYEADIRDIHRKVTEYLATRERGLLLIDNVDKGWGAHGVDEDDVLIVSTLIDALRKVERQAGKSDAKLDWLLFLRNDVFELLVDQQNDRGKDGKIIVDWDSKAALSKVIQERISASGFDVTGKDVPWANIAVPTVSGEASLDWMVRRSLMRPRYLIQLCDECIGHADAAGHERIEEDDFQEGFRNFSLDIIGNTNFELRDVEPQAEDAIYALIGMKRKSTLGEIEAALRAEGYTEIALERCLHLFFWFAVLGADTPTGGERYIYDYRYDMKLFSRMRKTAHDREEIVFINPAFARGLDCVDLI
ncbi:hypothetical protein JQV19_19240 [Sulfitobacter mediterraneus]|uniref:P-loop ATPase, Sll1717 family n=1 Tax=Sulfitobacter mediterraneus TaxID=83219 RepID=UPI001939C899|nr:hypothetical protein [Sulfitobacter mediterraneus]MBM1558391.1 hypothetical protein [Sulfitobacter mediterraneus]MBM1570333.1 hypothetical protein [Sulfitobacter mediterraneus]MBM1574146.1 hypothetical protein [Sulfitobacter mediterraneus]MBM1577942.1 hypothetical protein [Sulfitobacter mediterraneus]MBM1581379.1 hypothetical protein [Sulfitobacter mediterraneus]